jgi:hypothetical protein
MTQGNALAIGGLNYEIGRKLAYTHNVTIGIGFGFLGHSQEGKAH